MTGAAISLFLVLWLMLLGTFAEEAREMGKDTPTAALILVGMSALLALSIGAVGFAFDLLVHGLWDAVP